MTTAFVSGATGYTGRAVVRELASRGITTVAHVRPDSPRVAEFRAEFSACGASVDVTPWIDDAFAATLSALRPNLVFALLGTTRKREAASRRAGLADSSYETVDYGMTVTLLRASIACGAWPRFVYLSALGAQSGRGAYYRARQRVEAEVVESGLPYLIARPSLITGQDRAEVRPGERVAAVLADATLGVASVLGASRLRNRYASMTADELSRGLVALALEATAPSVIAETEELRRAGAPGTRGGKPG